MTPRYALMLAVLLGPFGCDPDPARGPKPETRAENLERRLAAFGRQARAGTGRAAEPARQHHDGQDDHAPEQQHADTHPATPVSKSESMVSPHHVQLPSASQNELSRPAPCEHAHCSTGM